MSESFVPLTPGTGAYKVATYRFTFGAEDREISRFALNDATGAELKGQKPREDSLPVAFSPEDVAAILENQSGRGWVALPASGAPALAVPVRAVLIYGPGNLVLELEDGTLNTGEPIPVTAGMQFAMRAIRKGATCTAGVIGLK
jgi:hypothetical protein